MASKLSVINFFTFKPHQPQKTFLPGTILVENKEGAKIINEEILTTEETLTSIAEKLAMVCQWFGFDGWLLNMEAQVDASKIPLLKIFVKKLREFTHEKVHGSKVIWYDSVIKSGELQWQNGLNEKNE